METIKTISKWIYNLNELAGYVGWMIVLVLMVLGFYDVCMRYFFDAPSQWIYIILKLGVVVIVSLCSGYSFQHDCWVRIDILYDRYSKRTKAFIDLFCLPFMALFLAILLWTSVERAMLSVSMGQMTPTALRIPLYPVKVIIPIGVFLLLLAVVNHVLKNILIMIDDDNDLKLFEKDRG